METEKKAPQFSSNLLLYFFGAQQDLKKQYSHWRFYQDFYVLTQLGSPPGAETYSKTMWLLLLPNPK